MVNWLFVVVVASSLSAVGEVKITPMTEAQCRAAVDLMRPLKGKLGAACVGPDGSTYEGR